MLPSVYRNTRIVILNWWQYHRFFITESHSLNGNRIFNPKLSEVITGLLALELLSH